MSMSNVSMSSVTIRSPRSASDNRQRGDAGATGGPVAGSGPSDASGADRTAGTLRVTPRVLGYSVGPVALGLLVVLRHLDLVSATPLWAYVALVVLAAILGRLVEPWHAAPVWSWRINLRMVAHTGAVTAAIYLTGWGPVLVVAYAFVALQDMEECCAAVWRPAMVWTFVNIAVGQLLVSAGWLPSLLTRGQAEVIGVLGAFAVGIVIRMAGATGEKKEHAEAQLARQALQDPLTGLANRQLLVDRLGHAIDLSHRRATAPPVVMFLDLDRFKLVNDTLGHRAGDRLLVEVAQRLTNVLRSTDTLARFGGDEFVVLCEDASGAEAIGVVSDRIRAAFDEPFDLGGDPLTIGVSVGIARVDDAGKDAETVLGEADAAMYLAKTQGSAGKVQLFTEAARLAAIRRVDTETALYHALERDELLLYYQPMVDISTRRVVGVEALLRWMHPERGLLPPAEFLELAEQSGLIVPIGEWVLESACQTVSRWNRWRSPLDQLTLSVNLSPSQLAEADLVDSVASLLHRSAIESADLRLSFEVRESFLPVQSDRDRRRLHELHDLGVEIAVDDFGTGASSLAYVKDLPVSIVKIDGCFTAELGRHRRSTTIMRSIIDLAHSINLNVVAEAVETDLQCTELRSLGCDFAQGYLFGRPQPADELVPDDAATAPTL